MSPSTTSRATRSSRPYSANAVGLSVVGDAGRGKPTDDSELGWDILGVEKGVRLCGEEGSWRFSWNEISRDAMGLYDNLSQIGENKLKNNILTK